MKYVVIYLLLMSTCHFAVEAAKTKERLRVTQSIVDLLNEQIKELTAVPHKGVRPHLRKNGKVK